MLVDSEASVMKLKRQLEVLQASQASANESVPIYDVKVVLLEITNLQHPLTVMLIGYTSNASVEGGTCF